jgi:hypothetical protein
MTNSDPLQNVPRPEGSRRILAHLLREKARHLHTVVPASTAQRGVWFMQQLDPATHAYHLPFCVRVLSAINLDGVKAALDQLVDRHATLRSTFRCTGQLVEMLVHGAADPEFAVIDAGGWTDQELQQRAGQSFRRPFDLEKGPLVRLRSVMRPGSSAGRLICPRGCWISPNS